MEVTAIITFRKYDRLQSQKHIENLLCKYTLQYSFKKEERQVFLLQNLHHTKDEFIDK